MTKPPEITQEEKDWWDMIVEDGLWSQFDWWAEGKISRDGMQALSLSDRIKLGELLSAKRQTRWKAEREAEARKKQGVDSRSHRLNHREDLFKMRRAEMIAELVGKQEELRGERYKSKTKAAGDILQEFHKEDNKLREEFGLPPRIKDNEIKGITVGQLRKLVKIKGRK